MVAAGAAALMAASESGSSKGNDVTTQYETQNAQRSGDNSSKRIVKAEKKNSFRNSTGSKTTPIRETKASRLRAASIVSPTDGTASSRKSGLADGPTAWSSQLGTSSLKKPKSPVSSTSKVSSCVTRERDKIVKRPSLSIKSPEAEEKRPQLITYYEKGERTRMRKTMVKQSSGSKAERSVDGQENASFSEGSDFHQQSTGFSTDSRAASAIACSSGTKTRSSTQRSSSSIVPHENSEVLRRVDVLTALTRATMERVERLTSSSSPTTNGKSRLTSGDRNPSVSSSIGTGKNVVSVRKSSKQSDHHGATNSRIDTSSGSRSNNNENSSVDNRSNNNNKNAKNGMSSNNNVENSAETSRQQNRQPPISILKHKSAEVAPDAGSSSSVYFSYKSQATNFAPTSIIEQLTKKHGILKKRSSLDDNEILRRRRSCSPDAVFPEANGADFKPILKYERRSSLDGLVKQSCDSDNQFQLQQDQQQQSYHQQQHPTSILKRKSSGEEERDDGPHGCSNEPTSILKRSSGSSGKISGNGHHVSIAAAVAKTLGCIADSTNGSEVRPILKKKFSREESSSSDPPSLEPRPILKKKSSTDSDEHDERPKTILKSSRKSSQEDSGNEIDSASPRKLSMLKNRSVQRRTNSLPECDVVRPILKQCASRESCSPSSSNLPTHGDSLNTTTKDLFLRKRAKSVGHVQSTLNRTEEWPKVPANSDQDKPIVSQINIHQNPSKIITWSRSNESTTSATTTTATTNTATTATATTTTATSSIAPIVSFKLPSGSGMASRYEIEDDDDKDFDSLGDRGTNSNRPDFRYNFGKRSEDEEEEENDDDDGPENRLNFKQRQNSHRQKDESNKRMFSSDSPFSTTQKSHFVSSSSSSEMKESKEAVVATRASPDERPSRNRGSEAVSNVSRIAQRFMNLEDQQRLNEKRASGRENSSRFGRESKDHQRYDRFNTQPVTYDEVREAVLLNQRKAASSEVSSNSCDRDSDATKIPKSKNEIEPSKLSLAERVRMFNRRIATESIEKISSSIERSQRRRPANRYKTQPITSEEVEVASRIFPSENPRVKTDESDSDESAVSSSTHNPGISRPSIDVKAPRSILKSSTSQTANDNRSLRIRDTNRKETDSAGIIDEAYLLSSELKLTRKEFTARRTHRRRRNNESQDGAERENGQRLSDDDDDENAGADSMDLNYREILAVPCSYDNIALHDKTDGTEIRDGCYDSPDNAETTDPLRERSRRERAPSIDKSCCISESDYVSFGRKEKITTEMQQIHFPSISIADRLAALQRRGTTDWKRRVNTESVTVSSSLVKFTDNEIAKDMTPQTEKDEIATRQRKLAERLEKLESAAEGWRRRVAVPDAAKFSVAGKMRVEHVEIPDKISPLIEDATNCANDGKKKTPRPERFRSCKSTKDATTVTGNAVDKKIEILEGSSESVSEESEDEAKSSLPEPTILSVPRADDETFTSFFSNVSFDKCDAQSLDFPEADFDVVTSFSERLGTRRTVQTQRRRLPSKNPLRTLAARDDIKDEYTEMTTGVAERVMRTLNVEKLAKKSSLAVEALAGLASTEDFGAVTLKNVDFDATGYGNRLPPHKDVMLILVKGRRHVQIRLVEPIVASINSGDNFILVTPNELYNYVGKYSNVIERARGAEVALSIQQNRDLGCRASHVIIVSEEKQTCTNNEIMNFWKILGADTRRNVEVIDSGHPDEDELYESALLDTNMVYEVVGEDELIPLDKYWGAMPKIEMLDPSKILVFDFGSEMYIWNGKIAPPERRKVATQLAEELWQEGYDYTECTVSPINAALVIGRRVKIAGNVKKGSTRPEWCLIGKLTQHMETVLFREKFLDWPNVSGVIRVKESPEKQEQVDGKIVVEPADVDCMIDSKTPIVDLILEGSHLGRGTGWYDNESLRQSVVATTDVTVWHIDEFSYSLLSGSSIGQFYTGDSYIVRWMYTVTITGRGLSGEPSKHASKGRDRCAYFIWQGQKASLNEQGTAALLTVELDQEQGPQIRVPEGFEPAAFLNLFSGRMIVHNGKKAKNHSNKKWRMYVCRGSEETETCLVEVPCSTRQLRSRGSLVLLDTKSGKIYIWHGRAALPRVKQNALKAAEILRKNRPEEAGLSGHEDVTITEINETDEEPAAFFEALGGMNKQLYVPLQGTKEVDHTPRLFHLSSVSGELAATELLCPHRGDRVTSFPFLQDELYQVNQPALFLLDNKDELWLWQGWWPDSGSEDQTGSGAVRWQAERRAAMKTAMRYWEKLRPESENCHVYLVRAGLEPLEFTNLFPTWKYRDDIAELNIRDGRDSGEVLTVEGELARLTQSTYPIAQLLQRPLPDGVDPTSLEKYLSPQHFEELLGMNIEEFEKLPAWKQINVKKKIGLF